MPKETKFRVIEYPFHIGDLVGGTAHLDDAQFGAYMRLLIANIQAGPDGLKSDQEVLRSYTRQTPKGWAKLWRLIGDKFEEKDGRVFNPRVAVTILNIINKSKDAQVKALKRWEVANAAALPEDSRGYANLKTSKPHQSINNNLLDSEPANPPQGEVSISSNRKAGGGPYRIMDHITERGRSDARSAAPGWDLQHLAQIFDKKIADASFMQPRNPDKAFSGWVALYTKGKPPS